MDVYSWMFLLIIPKPTPGIGSLWNCTITDVTDTVDTSELIAFFPDINQ